MTFFINNSKDKKSRKKCKNLGRKKYPQRNELTKC